jgi:hypothetical protein
MISHDPGRIRRVRTTVPLNPRPASFDGLAASQLVEPLAVAETPSGSLRRSAGGSLWTAFVAAS